MLFAHVVEASFSASLRDSTNPLPWIAQNAHRGVFWGDPNGFGLEKKKNAITKDKRKAINKSFLIIFSPRQQLAKPLGMAD